MQEGEGGGEVEEESDMNTECVYVTSFSSAPSSFSLSASPLNEEER